MQYPETPQSHKKNRTATSLRLRKISDCHDILVVIFVVIISDCHAGTAIVTLTEGSNRGYLHCFCFAIVIAVCKLNSIVEKLINSIYIRMGIDWIL